MKFYGQHPTQQRTHSTRRPVSLRAFTLIELLLAATVSILLVGLLLLVISGIGSNYTHTQGAITRQGDISFAIDQLVQDLEGYVIPNFSTGEGLKITPETVEGTTNAVWLTLLSTATDADNSNVQTTNNFTGATRAISYRLAYQNTISSSAASDKSYALYRSISSAKHTFDNVTSNSTNMQAQYWPSAPSLPTAIGNFLSENAVAFSVRFLRADTGQWTLPSDTVRIGRDGSTINGTSVPGGFLRAEVSVTVLSPEGAQRVKDNVLSVNDAISRYGQTAVRQTSFF